MENELIEYTFRPQSGSHLSINFNGLSFQSYNIFDYVEQNSHGEDYVEYLPGVFIRKVQKYNDFIEVGSNKLDNQRRENPTLVTVLKSAYWRLLKKIFYKRQLVKIIIEIRNKRDAIEIKNHDTILFHQSVPVIDALQKNYDNRIKYSSDYTEEFKWVDTTKIMYPFRSGGNGERCRIKGIFQTLDLLDGYNHEHYSLFSEHEMFLASSQSDGLMQECKKFERCVNICDRFHNHTYSQPTEEKWFDEIELNECSGVYEISNANHRVCIAKRFNVPFVYAKVYKFHKDQMVESQERSNDLPRDIFTRGDNQKILSSFYNRISRLDLKKECGHHILQKGLRGEKLVNYIEQE